MLEEWTNQFVAEWTLLVSAAILGVASFLSSAARIIGKERHTNDPTRIKG